jgi:hypothetical protein
MIAGWLFIVRIGNVCGHINGLKLMVEMLFQRLLLLLLLLLPFGVMECPGIIITARESYIERETIRAFITSKRGGLKQKKLYTCQDIELPPR